MLLNIALLIAANKQIGCSSHHLRDYALRVEIPDQWF